MPGVTMAPPAGKVNHYGIEVVSALTWQGWEPGQEYTRNIILKNIRVKTQKLKYKVPESRFFSTMYPQPVVLSAGTSFTLPVTFRPLERVHYEDKIEFSTNEGRFAIPIRAVLPQMSLAAPDNINFNMCAARDNIQLTFNIKNKSELVTAFRVETEAPFSVEPAEGILQPFSTFSLNTTFKPTAALFYEGTAKIHYGTENQKHHETVKLTGIGKYPHLVVSGGVKTTRHTDDLETVVDFGEITVGKNGEKWIDLKNISAVNAPFKIDQPSRSRRIDPAFHCLQKHGVVPAYSSIRIPIIYTPHTVNETSIDYFEVKTISKVSKTVIKCTGHSKGPLVHLSQTAINFHQVNIGLSVRKTFDIANSSDGDAYFQFIIDCEESVFHLDCVSGILSPGSKRTIILTFHPTHPLSYYKRLACVVHNQGTLFLDLLGTCHSEKVKPAVLQVKHIHRFQVHTQRGLSFLPPEHLNEMVRDGKLKPDDRDTLVDPKGTPEGPGVEPPVLSSMDEYFNDGHHSDTVDTSPHISMDTHLADFGQCQDMRIINKMNVNLTNHTKGKITVVWMGGEDHVFSVSPTMVDIPPQASAPFSVTFKPKAVNQFYGAELECYAYYKSLRDHKLVEDLTHCPSWCLNLTATGDTFQPGCETFLPRVTLDSQNLLFPAVNTGESSYRTLLLSNHGTTPVLYKFENDPTGVFSMKPMQGLMTTTYQVFVVKILPTTVKTYKHTMHLSLNNDEKNTQKIEVAGSAEMADVVLENNAVIYFKPTCVGTTSTRKYSIQNTSRIPLRFDWKMTSADSKLLTVTPSTGIIQPNEVQHHIWQFTPQTENKYVMKPAVVVWGQGKSSQSSAGRKRQFTVRGLGEGTAGSIICDQAYLDFGTITIGTTVSRYVTLYNNSTCSLHYKLNIDQTVTGPYSDEEYKHDVTVLDLDLKEGVLPARARQVVVATIQPHRRVQYQCALSYQLLAPSGVEGVPSVGEKQHLCHLLATGVFPTLAITDIRSCGSAANVSKKQLWSNFSIDHLNSCLDADPSPRELMYTASTRQSHRKRPPVYTRAIVDFNFGAAPIDSDACVIQIMIENTGTVATQWQLMFPRELQLELECWAESGEYELEELNQMKVEDNELFSVSPPSGDLEPGQSKMILFSYKHKLEGTNRIPVLLKLASGREILLNFMGVTVAPDRHYIHFPSDKYTFSPVPISELNSPVQIYEMYNGGALSVNYEINTVPLQIMKNDHFDHAIFECLNPVGEVLPGRSAAVQWRFSPLEARTYMVDVPISIVGGETIIVTFTGIGYDKRIMGNTMLMTDQHENSGAPSSQCCIRTEAQLCYLLQERASFGNLPLFSRARRLVTIANTSQQHAVTYRWHVTAAKDSPFVTVSPATGHIGPGQSMTCKVTFTAKGLPSFYDIDLVCEVLNETEAGEYQRALQDWNNERYRQQVEFTITEDDLDADLRLPDPDERPPSGRLKSLDGTRTPSPEAELAKYKALPPIKLTSTEAERMKWKMKAKLENSLWPKPQAPKPFILHLGVTARTHNIADFQVNFPDLYKKFYIDRTLSDTTEILPTSVDQSEDREPITCQEAEVDVLSGALATIIRGVLDDEIFHEAIESVAADKTPYFVQYADKQPRRPATPAPSIVILDIEEPESTRSRDSHESVRSKSATEIKIMQRSSEGQPQFAEVKFASPRGSSMVGYRTHSESKIRTPDHEMESISAGHLSSRSSTRISPTKTHDTPDPLQTTGDNASLLGNAFAEEQKLKRQGTFGSLAESVIENTIANIIQEAFLQEFNITARPRLVAMLPRAASATSKK